MKKLYLHMGFHKTATTSFQETCKKNKELLLEQGFEYPLFNNPHMKSQDIANHSLPLYSLFSDDPEEYYINIVTQITDFDSIHASYHVTLERALTKDANVILSGEDVSVLSEEFLQKLKVFLTKYNFEIVPLLVIRSPYTFSCSLRQQLLRGGRLRSHYTPAYRPSIEGNYFLGREHEFEKILKVFPNTLCFPFKKICKHSHGPTGFLLEQIGVDYTQFDFINSNESSSNVVVRVQEVLNAREEIIKDGKLNPNFVRIIDLDSKTFKQKYLLTEAEYALVKDQCEASNAYFREHLGEEYTDAEIKFSQEDDVVKLCTGLINRLEKKFKRQLAERDQEKAKIYALQRCVSKAMRCLQIYYYLNYIRCRIGAEITFGAPRKRYKAKKKEMKQILSMLSKKVDKNE